jgi:hypothetical protein
MSDWPKKMWMDASGHVSIYPGMNECVPVLVYPADQAPEPVGFTIRDDNSGAMIARIDDHSVPEYAPLYLAPPSESFTDSLMKRQHTQLMEDYIKLKREMEDIRASEREAT